MPGESMTKYATMNPLGSTDPRDMFDNSQNLDFAMSDIASAIWTDRFGKKRNTFYGFELFARAAISAFGYITIDSFQAGATLTLYNQILRDTTNGEYYRWDGALPKEVPAGSTPATTGGVGLGAWVGVGDATLRSELAKPGGVNLVQGAAKAADLLAHESSSNPHPQMTAFITAEADRSEAAADAASTSGSVYPDTASGVAATTNGQYFSVVSPVAEGYLDLYRNNSGAAAFQKTYPSSALVKRLDDGFNKLTGDNGFSMDGSDGQSFIEVKKGDAKALVIGTHSTEMMVFDTISKKVNVPASDLADATVSKVIHLSDSEETESENTEDLITSTRAKTIGSGKHSLIFDTVNGELISTFKIVDRSQNPWPTFDNDVPHVVTGIPPEYAFEHRLYQAIPTIARTGTRFWLSWRADVITAGEGCGNFFIIGYSDDNCNTVTETHVIRFDNLNHQLIDTMLWTNPETGELWIFWSSSSKAQPFDGMEGCWCSVLENPTATTGFSWSTPYRYRNLGHPRRPVRVAGRWMQCIDNFANDANYRPLYPETAGCEFVDFDPRTRTTVNIGHNTPNNGSVHSGFFESEVVQLRDGRLMSTTRSYSNSVETTRSFSTDGGKTWSTQETYTALGETTSSRMWLGRTPSGRLLVAYNNYKTRTNMVVKLSDDDGETYPYSVVLEGPSSPQLTTYPVVAFDGDLIYVTYDYGRQVANEIRVTVVRESEIVAGTSVPAINIISGPTV